METRTQSGQIFTELILVLLTVITVALAFAHLYFSTEKKMRAHQLTPNSRTEILWKK